MQSKWNASCMRVGHGLSFVAVGAIVTTSITPSPARALTYEEAIDAVGSSPASVGVGIAVGALAMGLISRLMYKRMKKRLEQRVNELELAHGQRGQFEPDMVEQPTSAINMQALLDERDDSASEDVGKHGSLTLDQGGSMASQIPVMEQPVVAGRSIALEGPDASAKEQTAKSRSLDATLSDLLHGGDDLPVIERGEGSLELYGARAELEHAHSMQVLKNLNRTTRSRMLTTRLPDLGTPGAGADAITVDAKDEISADLLPLDPSERVDMILREELELNNARIVREYAHTKPVLPERTGDANASEGDGGPSGSNHPQGRHFTVGSREA